MNDYSMIPIFPLGVVLLPGLPMPLHIFEERYKLMVRRCLEQKRPFGLIYYDGKSMSKRGCTAAITQVLKHYADGRMDIMTRGQDRFRVNDIHESEPYLQAQVEYFDDIIEEPTEEIKTAAERALSLLSEYQLLTDPDQRLPEYEDIRQLSFQIAGNEGFTAAEKQTFLQMTSTTARLLKSMAAFENVIERLKVTESIRKIVGGNGQIPTRIQGKLNDTLK